MRGKPLMDIDEDDTRQDLEDKMQEVFGGRVTQLIGNRTLDEIVSDASSKGIILKRSMLSRCAHGKMPTAVNLVALAEYFDCSVDYLLGRYDNATPTHIDIGSRVGLSDESIDLLQSLMKTSAASPKAESQKEKSLLIITINRLISHQLFTKMIESLMNYERLDLTLNTYVEKYMILRPQLSKKEAWDNLKRFGGGLFLEQAVSEFREIAEDLRQARIKEIEAQKPA